MFLCQKKEVMALEITNGNYAEIVEKTDLPVVIDLWAVWCGPCKRIGPLIEEMAEEYEGRAVIGKVDVDSNPEISQKFSVLNIPTVLFIKNGEEVDRVVGAVPKKKLVSTLEKYL